MLRKLRALLRPVKRAYRRAAAKALPRLLKPLHVSVSAVVDGSRWRIPVIRGVGLANRHGHERWMTDLLRRLFALTASPGLVDVGVNTGQTLLKLKGIDRALHYHGFEPNPFCVLFTTELIALNALAHCSLYPAALSDSARLLGFVAESEADPAGSMLGDFRPGKSSFREQYIATLVFDALGLAEAERCRVVKIDVEGAELHVLRGMTGYLRRARPVVVCEVLHAHSEAKLADLAVRNRSLVELLAGCAYRIYRLHRADDRIERIEPVLAFPDVVWGSTSSEACDYLFVPEEEAPRFEGEFSA